MRAHLYAIMLLACVAHGVAQEAQRGPMPRELKPQWQRVLTGEDAAKAAEVERRLAATLRAGHRDEALELAEELLGLRTRAQGADHWQTRNATATVQDLKRPLNPEQQRRVAEADRLNDQALALYGQAKFAEAAALTERALNIRKELLGGRHPRTATSLNNLAALSQARGRYAEAESEYREALQLHRELFGAGHPDTANVLSNLADLYQARGKYADAEPLVAEALRIRREALGERHPDTAISLNSLATLYRARNQYTAAEPLYRETLRITKEARGDAHPYTAAALGNLAGLCQEVGKHSEAEPLYREALRIYRAALGDGHPSTATGLSNLAVLYHAQGRYLEAEPLFREALRVRRERLGDGHPDTAAALGNLAGVHRARGRYAAAEPLYREALGIKRAALGDRHPDTALALANLGGLYREQGKYADAEPLLGEALRIGKAAGDRGRITALALTHLALLCQARGRHSDAELLYRESVQVTRAALGAGHPDTAGALCNLAELYREQARWADAEALYREALGVLTAALGHRHPNTAAAVGNLALLYQAQGRYAEAEPLHREALGAKRAALGDRHPNIVTGLTNLATLYRAQGKYPEAEPLLAESVRGFEASRLAGAHTVERAVVATGKSPYPSLAAVSAHLGRPADAYRALEADLARGLLDELVARGGAGLTADDEAGRADLAARLTAIEARLLRLISLAKLTDAEGAEMSRLTAERREHEAALSRLATDMSRRAVADLATVQAALDPATALVAWVDSASTDGRVRDHWACVVRRTGGPKWERLPGTGADRKWVDEDEKVSVRLRAALESQNTPAGEIERWTARLRAQRIAPVQKHLDGVRRLLVVGTDLMAGIPVELLVPEYQIEYTPSGTSVARAAGNPKLSGPPSVLAVGDPAFARADAAPAEDPPLPPGGLLVLGLVPGGAADGVLKAGDVLLAYGGTDLTDPDVLGAAIAANVAAKSVPVKVWRVTEWGEAVGKTVDLPPGRLGVSLASESARDALSARHKANQMLAAAGRSGRVDPKTGEKKRWVELPGTAVELDRLRKLFGDRATILVRSAASEQKLETMRAAGELTKFRYLHLATHGLANDDRAFESFLVLAQDHLPRYGAKPGERPFNGELSAREVLDDWKLDNCDLVTLSACESGLGRSGGGDGLLGFVQAFLVAGARSVCVSLWAVDDTATALLMERFYRNLLGKREGLDRPMKKAAALREAKAWLRELSADEVLKLSADMSKGIVRGKDEPLPPVVEARAIAPKGDLKVKPYADPRFWAAFVLVGDPD